MESKFCKHRQWAPWRWCESPKYVGDI